MRVEYLVQELNLKGFYMPQSRAGAIHSLSAANQSNEVVGTKALSEITDYNVARPLVGLVIGAFASVPYIHLHMESWHRYYPEIPVLVHDDCSPQAPELERLCRDYGADFVCNEVRYGHQAGDLSAYLAGIRWGQERKLDLLVKLSQRFVPIADWTQELQQLFQNAPWPTYTDECKPCRHAFRSESAVLHLSSWAPFIPVIEEGVSTRDFGIVENFMNNLALRVARLWEERLNGKEEGTNAGGEAGGGCAAPRKWGYQVWPLLGDDGTMPRANHLWHRAQGIGFYLALAQKYGLTDYLPGDFQDTATVPYKSGKNKPGKTSPPQSLGLEPQSCPMQSLFLEKAFEAVCQCPSDINEHLPLLAQLSSRCKHVTEITSCSGNSTISLLYGDPRHGRPRQVITYDLNSSQRKGELFLLADEAGVGYEFMQSPPVLQQQISSTDLLFIDSFHTYKQLSAELRLHAEQVSTFIVLHDTTTFGQKGEKGQRGLWPAVEEFLNSQGPQEQWNILARYSHNHGLTVLGRNKEAERIFQECLTALNHIAGLQNFSAENGTPTPDSVGIASDAKHGERAATSLCEMDPLCNSKSKAGEHTVVTVEHLYEEARRKASDINEHLELLARLASLCDHVTEFGGRDGNSTVALLYGKPATLRSYAVNDCPIIQPLVSAAQATGVDFLFEQADSRHIEIDETDLLFIDTYHTYEQLRRELFLHARKVRQFLVVHSTSTFGDCGEDGRVGLWPAIARFLRTSPEWEMAQYYTHNNGLTVLRRCRA
jgi:hypothetical protein